MTLSRNPSLGERSRDNESEEGKNVVRRTRSSMRIDCRTEQCERLAATLTIGGVAVVASPWCVECSGKLQEEEYADKRDRHIERCLRENGVPPAMREWSIASFPLDDTPGRAAAYEAARAWLADFRGGKRLNLYLHGPVGVGKTWLAVSIARRLCEEGVPAYFILWRDLLADMRAAFRSKQSENGDETWTALDRARSAAVLVLDDLGAERPTEWAMEELAGLVQRRSNVSAPLVVTSNYSPQGLSAYLGGDLTAGRILDRLLDGASVHEAQGVSRRHGIFHRGG